MKTFFVLLLAAIAISLALGDEVYSASDLEEWNNFKTKHGKVYDDAENSRRLRIYSDTKKRITEHNAKFAAGQVSYSMRINQFADQLSEELPRGHRA